MFITYENRNARRVSIHTEDCNQLYKHGGKHSQNQGEYKKHKTYEDALAYANTLESKGYELHICPFCKPKGS